MLAARIERRDAVARLRRRRRRRPRRLRRRASCGAASASSRCRRRCSPRSIPRSAARPASTPAAARTSSAPSTSPTSCSPTPASSTRCRRAMFNAGYAEVAKYGLIGDAAFFAWLEANWRAVAAGWPEREHAIAVACRAKAADRRRRRARRAAPAPSSISATPSAMRSRPPPAIPTASSTARRWRSAWCSPTGFSARLGLAPAGRRRPRRRATSPRSACRPASPTFPARGSDAETLMRHIAQDKKVDARQAHLHPDARHRPGLHRPRRPRPRSSHSSRRQLSR